MKRMSTSFLMMTFPLFIYLCNLIPVRDGKLNYYDGKKLQLLYTY